MLYAEDFREIARRALSGRWGMAIGTGFIASLLGVNAVSGNTISRKSESMTVRVPTAFISVFAILISSIIMLAILSLFLGGVIKLGYCRFNQNLINNTDPKFSDIFSRFDIFWKACGMNLLIQLYTLLWSLLFVIPGIIASLSYAMAPYIMANDPYMNIQEALQQSKDMMYGNKWRLFCLNISFIGWMILSAFTLGIGLLWLNPYMSAAQAAFYNDVSGRNNKTANEEYF
ncbi:DUF975 family protein [Anaerocolumna sp.]|uniref:DUF975 family protein n=1 Tax=Anaerocolumna sp. TaxID=2041569 RepID=UPI0028AB507E|nr:DUF975 family protein [Anaerocolumna sp.]